MSSWASNGRDFSCSNHYQNLLLSSYHSVSPELHWLPVQFQIKFKILSFALKVITTLVLHYLLDLPHISTRFWSSSSIHLCHMCSPHPPWGAWWSAPWLWTSLLSTLHASSLKTHKLAYNLQTLSHINLCQIFALALYDIVIYLLLFFVCVTSLSARMLLLLKPQLDCIQSRKSGSRTKTSIPADLEKWVFCLEKWSWSRLACLFVPNRNYRTLAGSVVLCNGICLAFVIHSEP